MEIKEVKALEVLDSRGNPTVMVTLSTDSFKVSSMVPSGASTGVHEAHELRDKDSKRFLGKGVLKACENVNKTISKNLIGKDCTKQDEIDRGLIELDGTENKENLGANAILGASMAVCKAGAMAKNIPLYQHINEISGSKKISLPVPQMNIINSGRHVGVDNDIQEHMILPIRFPTFDDALRAGTETYHQLKKILREDYGARETLLGDEGGFSPHVLKIEKRLDLMMQAIKEAGYEGKIMLGLDCAASEFFRNNEYRINGKHFAAEELIDYYTELIKKYPIASIEDGMHEDDWDGWASLNKKLGKKVQLVGDDLLVTNIDRIKLATNHNACNALLLKVNQIGSVSEAIDAAKLTWKNGWKVVVSHRSGETSDSFISDLVVGLGASQSKFGAPARSERTSKYNRLLQIEDETDASFQKM